MSDSSCGKWKCKGDEHRLWTFPMSLHSCHSNLFRDLWYCKYTWLFLCLLTRFFVWDFRLNSTLQTLNPTAAISQKETIIMWPHSTYDNQVNNYCTRNLPLEEYYLTLSFGYQAIINILCVTCTQVHHQRADIMRSSRNGLFLIRNLKNVFDWSNTCRTFDLPPWTRMCAYT